MNQTPAERAREIAIRLVGRGREDDPNWVLWGKRLVENIAQELVKAHDAGRKQGWLDMARRDKSGDGFADGVHAGVIIGQSSFITSTPTP